MQRHPLSPLSSTLSYGVVAPDGAVDVRITYDARLLDGPTVARMLEELERVLTNDPASGVMRHADAGYDDAIRCAREQDLFLPMVDRQ